MIGPSCVAVWGFRLVVLLPMTAACTPHTDRLDPCFDVSRGSLAQTYCSNGSGDLSLFGGGVTPPKPDPAPQPSPEPSPQPSPEPSPEPQPDPKPKPPKPDHDDDDHDDDDDRKHDKKRGHDDD